MPYIGNIVQDFSVNTAMLNTDSVTSIKIDDGTIVNADINDSAAIAMSKLALSITNSEVNASAAIAGTKISPDFGSQVITTTGKVQAGDDVEVVVSSGDAFILTKGGTNQGHLVKKADNTTVAGITNGGAVSGGVDDAAVFAPAGDLKLMAGGNNVNSNLIVDVTSSGIDVTGAITGTADMTIDTNTLHVDSSNNRVGIGTTSPDTLLHLAGGSPYIKLHNTGSSASADDIFGAILFQHADADDPGITAKIQCVAEDNAGNSFLAFYNGDGGNADERLRITSAGDVTFGTQSGGSAPTSSSQIRHFDFGRDHWSGTAGDYRALRLKVYNVSNDDVYGFGISSNLLEIQSQTNIGFFAGTAGGGTGRRIERARIDATNGRLQLSSTTLRIDNAIAPESHAQLNIGSTGSSETRAIDIDGNWGNGEHKSITFTHGTSTSDIVGQINCVHNSPDSSLRFGKLYHGGNSTAYTMTLDSTSTSGANLTLHDGNLIFANGHGIDFSATSDPSSPTQADSELLDNYEEGTWTPGLSGSDAITGHAYSSRNGFYTRIGDRVYCDFSLVFSNKGSITGTYIQIVNLPYAIDGNSYTRSISTPIYFRNLNDSWCFLGLQGFEGQSKAYIFGTETSGGSTDRSYPNGNDISNTTEMTASFSYLAA